VDPLNLFVSLVLGSIGVGYFIYGKKQGKMVALLAGLVLMVFPYFVSNLAAMLGIGAAVMAAPYLAGRIF
jgi:hypothetical protein